MADSEIVQRIALKAVVIDDEGRVLLLREATAYDEGSQAGRYGLPGGHLEPGEAWQDGLRREVVEETGLEIDILRPIYVGEWRPVIKGVQNQIVATFLICRAKDPSGVRLSDEYDAYEWVAADTWENYDFMTPDDDVLRSYFRQASV